MAAPYGLGVDLGTTYTAAALWRNGRAECVPLGGSSVSVPSVLFLRDDDMLLVGEAAVRRGIGEPERVAREFKRRFGDDVPMLLGDLEVTPAELAGQLLRWVVDSVTEREGGPPAHVTLTHPATWREHRTALLVAAAENAGLTDVGLLAEPVAAAAFYSSTERLEPGSLLAVYDLGGGTFDATVVSKTPTGFAVQGRPVGDPGLGGADFDQAVMDHVLAALGGVWRTLDLHDPSVVAALALIRRHAVVAKEGLSVDPEVSVPVVLPGLVRYVRITRSEFESAVRIPLLRTVDLLGQAIDVAGVDPADIRTALLVGGSSRIPLVAQLVATQLGLAIGTDAHPKYAVCLGAAIAAGARLEPLSAPQRVAAAPPADSGWAPPGGVAAPSGAAVPSAPVRVDVDLAGTGITAAVDRSVTVQPAVPRWTPVVLARDEPLEVQHTGDRRRGVRTAILVTVLALAVLAALVVLGSRARAAPSAPGAGSAPVAVVCPGGCGQV